MTSAPKLKLVICRGLPGSGKSTWAKSQGAQVYSADDWFTKPDGSYHWRASEIAVAHANCKVGCAFGMTLRLPLIIIDNTNSTKSEYQDYLDLAEDNGYEVEIKYFPCDVSTSIARNIHNVPRRTIERMAKRWEP
jgi:predicted kinase